jgi:methyltransferase (TIGR00027 family)
MEEGRPSFTAIGAAMMRAAHVLLDEEPTILKDDFVLRLSGLASKAALRTALDTLQAEFARRADPDRARAVVRHLRGSIVMRSRYTEDELSKAIARGVTQYVILGAGLDSFAYRRQDLAGVVRIFEVDYPATQQWKRARLRELGIEPPPNLRFIPLDFEQQPLRAGLQVEGYRPEAPAFFSWLGVVPYLTEEAVLRTLHEVASSAVGSEIVFDYAVPRALLNEEARHVWAVVEATSAARGEPTPSLFEPESLAAQVREGGFAHVWGLSAEEAFARYFASRADGLRNLGGQHFIKARVGE